MRWQLPTKGQISVTRRPRKVSFSIKALWRQSRRFQKRPGARGWGELIIKKGSLWLETRDEPIRAVRLDTLVFLHDGWIECKQGSTFIKKRECKFRKQFQRGIEKRDCFRIWTHSLFSFEKSLEEWSVLSLFASFCRHILKDRTRWCGICSPALVQSILIACLHLFG